MNVRPVFRSAAAIGLAALLVGADGIGPAAAASPRAEIHSPLRAGARPGCRWVQGAAKVVKTCNKQTGVCRTQEVPAQRIWACGTVRD